MQFMQPYYHLTLLFYFNPQPRNVIPVVEVDPFSRHFLNPLG